MSDVEPRTVAAPTVVFAYLYKILDVEVSR
jgi:hypothetical protein